MSTHSAIKRRNTEPTSSVVRVKIKAVDCSGMSPKPEDGEFIYVTGNVGTRDAVPAADRTVAAQRLGAKLRMVWGSALRTDIQALDATRVPVVQVGPVEFKTKLYHALNEATALNDTTNFAPGTLVGVVACGNSIEGSVLRLVVRPVVAGEIFTAVGVVVDAPDTLPPSGDAITIRLFDVPQLVELT